MSRTNLRWVKISKAGKDRGVPSGRSGALELVLARPPRRIFVLLTAPSGCMLLRRGVEEEDIVLPLPRQPQQRAGRRSRRGGRGLPLCRARTRLHQLGEAAKNKRAVDRVHDNVARVLRESSTERKVGKNLGDLSARARF